MSGIALALVALAVTLQLLGAVTLLLTRDALDRLHAIGPVSVFATILLVSGVVIDADSMDHVAKAVATGLVVWASSPFLTRAGARAIRVRRTGELSATTEEIDAGRSTR